jgi:hypothetical protein
MTLGTKLNVRYSGTSSSTKTIAAQLKISPEAGGTQAIKLKGTITGDAIDYNGVLCLEINNQASNPPSDPLGFDNENEPLVNQTISLKIAKHPKGDTAFKPDIKSSQCLGNHVEVSLNAIARRSAEQVSHVFSPPPTAYDYLFCLMHRTSGAWPHNLIPPTKECKQVSFGILCNFATSCCAAMSKVLS